MYPLDCISHRVLPGLLAAAVMLTAGCQLIPAGDPGNGGQDANQNGFIDIVPPPGVMFETDTNVKVRLINELSASDLADLAQSNGVDPSLIGLADIRARIQWTVRYATGDPQTIDSVERLAPFTESIEFACPQDVDLSVVIQANLLIPGGPPIAEVPIDFDLSTVDYQCGDTITYRAFTNDAGLPDQSVTVE